MSQKKYGGRIEGWRISNWNASGIQVAAGNLYDDPQERSIEGDFIRTSVVVKVFENNTKLETLNTIYDLGEPYVE